MGKGSKAPSPPNPQQTAAAQTGSNVSTAIANANLGFVNQNNPNGSLSYKQTGSHSWTDPTTGKKMTVPTYTATQKLNGVLASANAYNNKAQQMMAYLGNRQAGRLNNHLNKSFSLAKSNIKAPTLQTSLANAGPIQSQIEDAGSITRSYGPDDGYAEQRTRVEDALMARMQPQLDRDRDNLMTSLSNRGIKAGSEAYHMAMQDFDKQSNDARYGAILNAGTEQNRLAQLDQNQAAFGNQAQAQQYSQNASDAAFTNQAQAQRFGQNVAGAEFKNNANQASFANQLQLQGVNDQRALTNRNQLINESASLVNGAPISMPNFNQVSTPQIPNTDIAGLINSNYQAQVAQANQQQQAQNQLFGNLGTIGSAFLLSDERAKTDIKKIGKLKGENVYTYRYKGQPETHMGVMAQEVEKSNPQAVATGADGLKRVNYGSIFGVAK